MNRAKSVDEYIDGSGEWKPILEKLRKIVKATELEETVKWGGPVYTLKNKNVVGLGGFKEFVSVWFFQGVFLSDPEKVLVNAQEGKTKGLRQWRFTDLSQIDAQKLKSYVLEAIENQKAGKEIKVERKKSVDLPPELKSAFSSDNELKSSFESLTPGKQREYAAYISEAKQEATKLKRIAKISPMIKEGKGLNDRYK